MKPTESQERALNLDKSLCVTAGAGAGKTWVLVERYLKLLESGVNVSQILALTFTEKAAAEMKERVRKALFEKEGEEWKERLDEFNWCSISTFHSFCANLIRQYPLVTGIAPRFQVLDDVNLSLMQAEVFESLLSGECCNDNDRLIRTLTWYGSFRTRERLEYMYERRAEMAKWLESHRSMDSVKVWAEEIDKLILQEMVNGILSNERLHSSLMVLSRLSDTHSGSNDPGQKYLAEVGPIIKQLLQAGNDGEKLELLRTLDKVKGNRAMGSKKYFSEEEKTRLKESYDILRTALDEACLDSMTCGDEELTQRTAESTFDLIRVYDSYATAMDEAKKKANVIDFAEMISTARKLMDREEVVRSLRDRYRNLLVDEFQDTDPIQSMIVWAVAGDDPEDRLFIVGDPKQSIYGFRSADVAMFHDAKQKLVDKDPEAGVHLDVNFRSTRQVVDLVNHVFSRLMVDEDREYRFKYEGMCLSEEKSDDTGSVELMLPGSSAASLAGSSPEVSLTEPEMVAARIDDLLKKGEKTIFTHKDGKRQAEGRRPEYGDITILLRARTHLKMFEKALRDLNIPYLVHKGLGFFERQEVMDVYNILRFLADSSDDVSLYGMLRSPYFAFSDEELFFISRGHGFDLWHRLKNKAEQDDERSKMAMTMLDSWSSRAGRMPIDELLQHVQVTSGISAVYAAQTNSAQLLANLDKLTSMLRNAPADGICTPHQAVEWMENAMELAKLEGEAPMESSSINAVNIMTIHASKGLEFPIVVVPELGAPQRGSPSSILFDDEIGLGLTVLGKDYKMAKNAAMSLIEIEESEKDTEESKRLLYVAMTRARDHLILSGKIGSDKRTSVNWMDLLLSTIAPDGILPEVKEIRINEAVKVEVIRGGDIEMDETMKEKPIPMSLPEDLEGLPQWNALSRPGRRTNLTVTGLKAFESWPDRYIRTNVYGVPEGWLDTSPRSEAMLFGTAAHEVLQGRDPESVAKKYGLPSSSVINLVKIRDRFLNSQDNAGKTVYRELKFMTDVDGQRFLGTVDRLEMAASGDSRVVDFKTDAVRKGDEEKEAEKHADQLRAYSFIIAKALRLKAQSQVYFTWTEKYVKIDDRAGFEGVLNEKIRECSEQVLQRNKDSRESDIPGPSPSLEDV